MKRSNKFVIAFAVITVLTAASLHSFAPLVGAAIGFVVLTVINNRRSTVTADRRRGAGVILVLCTAYLISWWIALGYSLITDFSIPAWMTWVGSVTLWVAAVLLVFAFIAIKRAIFWLRDELEETFD
jgi:protein-S-isoprenylcysteine O-methyltransferase Ste14